MAAYDKAIEIKEIIKWWCENWECKTSQNNVTTYDATCLKFQSRDLLPYNLPSPPPVGLTIKPPFQCIELAKLLIGLKFAFS